MTISQSSYDQRAPLPASQKPILSFAKDLPNSCSPVDEYCLF